MRHCCYAKIIVLNREVALCRVYKTLGSNSKYYLLRNDLESNASRYESRETPYRNGMIILQ